MIRKLILVPLLAAGLVFTAAAPAAAATASDFRGVWTGVDVDGSNLTLLVVGGGSTFRVVYYDDDATVACADVPALLTTRATLSGDAISGDLSGFCFDGTLIGPSFTVWTFDAETGTLSDNHGAIYSR